MPLFNFQSVIILLARSTFYLQPTPPFLSFSYVTDFSFRTYVAHTWTLGYS